MKWYVTIPGRLMVLRDNKIVISKMRLTKDRHEYFYYGSPIFKV